jgi:hypothetical protein
MTLNRVHFGRWMLRNQAEQHRFALCWTQLNRGNENGR